MFEGFVNPGLVAGAALAGVPLLIHLLNRQRPKPLAWGAMRFVLAAYRKTRRQVQLENLLLLLLRMGAIALLALCVARPFADKGPLGPLTQQRRDLVLIMDTSASMGYREKAQDLFSLSTLRATELLTELDEPGGDRALLVLLGQSAQTLGWGTPERTLALLPALSVGAHRGDLAATLGQVVSLATEEAAGTGMCQIDVHLLCDMQRDLFRALTAEVSSLTPGSELQATPIPQTVPQGSLIRKHLDALHELGVQVVVEDFGAREETPPNLSIQSVRGAIQPIGENAQVQVVVDVANHGSSPRPRERVALSVNGNKLPIQQVDLAPRSSAEVRFSFQAQRSGPQALLAELEGDRLSIDNTRAGVINVAPPISILVVNGAPSTDLDKDEVAYLLLALEPLASRDSLGGQLAAPFETTEITPDELLSPSLDLAAPDVILLAGVPSLSAVSVEAIKDRVAAGATLVITMGSQLADLVDTNRRLFRADGTGLLPAELIRRRSTSRRMRYWRVASFEEQHPILRFFADELWKPLLTEVPLYSFVETRPVEGARVLITLDDANHSPLLIERRLDQGSVHLWTTSFQRDWTDIGVSPKTLVPLMHEWMLYAGTRPQSVRRIEPTEAISLVLAEFPRNPVLVKPGGATSKLPGDAVELKDGRWQLPVLSGSETRNLGLYKIQLDGAEDEPFAVAMNPAEGDLRRISSVELDACHPALHVAQAGSDSAASTGPAPKRGEVWRWLALCALLCVVADSLWAARLGRHRRLA